MPEVKLSKAEEAEFDRQNEIAQCQIDELLDELPDDVDAFGVMYALWVALTYHLADAGWTAEELARDVQWHATRATTEGSLN